MNKLAPQANVWYNKLRNNVVPGSAANTPGWINLVRRLIMDIIPQKQCLKCERFFPVTPEFFNRNKNYKDGLTTSCRICRKAYAAQYNQEHREEKNVKAKAHYHANSERILATQIKPYHQSHREEIRAYKKQWRQDNKEVRCVYDQQYYQEHKGQIIARVTKYIQENREMHHIWNARYRQTPQGRKVSRTVARNRRARLKGIPGTFTYQEFAEQIERQKNKCYWCKKKLTEVHADHVIPISQPGSTNYIDNIVAACPKCNASRRNRYPHEWPQGGRLL